MHNRSECIKLSKANSAKASSLNNSIDNQNMGQNTANNIQQKSTHDINDNNTESTQKNNETLLHSIISAQNKISKQMSDLLTKMTRDNPYKAQENIVDSFIRFQSGEKKTISLSINESLLEEYKAHYVQKFGRCQNVSEAISIALLTMIYKVDNN